jgi:hypothetical protein
VIRWSRRVDSTDGTDIFRVQATAFRCSDATCDTSTSLATLELGLVLLNTPTVLSMVWDAANDKFIFQKDADAPQELAYVWTDTASPSLPNKRLDVINSVPNCTGAPRPLAFNSARFDDVFLNSDAVVQRTRRPVRAPGGR